MPSTPRPVVVGNPSIADAAAIQLRITMSSALNLPFKDWGKLFHNAAAASAIADRLVHKGILIRILGKSKRSNEEVGE